MDPYKEDPNPLIPHVRDSEIVSEYQNHQPHYPVTTAGVKLVTLIGSVLMMAVGLWLSGEDWGDHASWFTWGILIAGFLLFLIGQKIDPEEPLPEKISRPLQRVLGSFQMRGWQLLLLMISPLLSLVSFWAAGTGNHMNKPALALSLWVIAITLAVFIGIWPHFPRSLRMPKKEIVILGLLVLGAGIIRGVSITKMPVVLSGDEASSGLSAVNFIEGGMDNIFRVGWYSFPAFHNWIQSIPIRIFGQTVLGLRFTSIFIGSITVAVVYLVGKVLFGQKTGLYSAIFLAAYHFHHHFSRIGLNNIWDAFWFVLILGGLWFGWHRDKRWAFILSGLALGFSQYFYVSSRLLLVLVPFWILVAALTDKPRFSRHWPNLILMGIVALVVVIPMAGFYIKNPGEYVAPFTRVSIMGDWLVRETENTGVSGWLIILKQLGSSFLGLVYLPLRFWYLPGVPLLRAPSATLFLVGLGALLLRPKDTRFHLLGLWVLAICIPGGLSDSVPAAQRYVAIAPALAILVGYGLDLIAVQVGQLLKPMEKGIHYLAILAIILIGSDDVGFYYFKYTPNSEFGGANSLVAQRLADTLQNKTPDCQVLFWGAPRMGYYSIPSLQYLVPEIEGLDMTHPWGSPENPQPASNCLIFVFLPDHEDELSAIQDDFPDGSFVQELDRKGRTLYWLYEPSPDGQDNH